MQANSDRDTIILSKLILAEMKKNGISEVSLQLIYVIIDKFKKINGISGEPITQNPISSIYSVLADFATNGEYLVNYVSNYGSCYIRLTDEQTKSILNNSNGNSLLMIAQQIVNEYKKINVAQINFGNENIELEDRGKQKIKAASC